MKQKGFTLVELLAVIVILAVISLIATPMILGVIETTKKGAAESSVLGYIDAVEKQIMLNQLDSTKSNIADRTYSVEELTELGVTIKGTVPTGTVTIENSQVGNYILGVNGYVVENGTTTKVSNTQKYDNGYAVYYNPVAGESCLESEAVSTTGTKTGCMKWYIYNDSEGASTVNMILDHNTTAKVVWNTDNINVAYENSNIKPLVDALVTESNWKNEPRLITAYEINQITGKTGWTSTSGWYCLDSKEPDNTNYCAKTKDTSNYKWLFDRTNDCENYGCSINDSMTSGYWTSTTRGLASSGHYIWNIDRSSNLGYCDANYMYRGIRPVITISKSIIS